MAEIPTISQLNKIGERLRKGRDTDDDRRQLDVFVSSFAPAFDQVFSDLEQLGLNPAGRSHKTTDSIIAKLNRERTRLSKMQDVAGCRLEVPNRVEQDRIVSKLQQKYPGGSLQDRRLQPSHGYRAVHLVVQVLEHQIEIQIRTSLQHDWASATEKLADLFQDITIKYGGGPEQVRQFLDELSTMISDFEGVEADYLNYRSDLVPELHEKSLQFAEKLKGGKVRLRKLCENSMITLGVQEK